jgi:hypothetical protein
MNNDTVIVTFKPEKYLWLRSRLQLDLMDVDTQVMELPVFIQEAGEIVAQANELREAAKDDLERTKAGVAQTLRQELEPNGKVKSESKIESQIPLQADYIAKLEQLSIARLDAALWASIVDALRAKSMAVRVAADLLNSGFLTPDYIRNKRRREIREVKV